MILHAVGMDDWVSGDADSYVARALAAAADTRELARICAALRQRVEDFPLCDAADLRLLDLYFADYAAASAAAAEAGPLVAATVEHATGGVVIAFAEVLEDA